MARDLPTGKVTLVFTDIEGSTRLLHELGPAAYAASLAEHRRILREAFGRHGGVEVDTQGDAFFYAFASAAGAVDAAGEGRDALRSGRVQVRVGIHTGTPHLTDEGYVGEDVHLGARIGAAGHGGQVLLSHETRRSALREDQVVDLGDHLLKDFSEPVRIFQLGAERFPPLKTISNTNLPHPASSFIGRRRETAEIVARLRDGARLVTLTGPGGSGKTRLSIAVAAEMVPDLRAGTFWVELASLREPALVLDEIATTLGASDDLPAHIRDREMLLVLDNLEQVVDAGPDLASLLETCPNLKILATSREPLRVRGEVEYRVQPLAALDAVELFVERAGGTPDDDVRRLCRALDDLPLAIELAAARASLLTPAQMYDRLSQRLDLLQGGRDADPRQRTLRSTIEWSYDLLDPGPQRLFARLSVFAGFTLDLAERVAEADLDTLQALVEKSLVNRTGDRFWMYGSIREFALERLEAGGEAESIRERHAECLLALAEEAEPHAIRESLRRPGVWMERAVAELDNFRAALDRGKAQGDREYVLALAGALGWLWERPWLAVEGGRYLAWALAGTEGSTASRAKALSHLAAVTSLTGDLTDARRAAEQAFELHREMGDVWWIGADAHTLGYIAAESGDWVGARAFFEESVRHLRDAGDDDSVLWSTRSVGWTYHDTGDLETAREIHEANLDRARELGNQGVEATTLGVLGTILVDEGRADEAFPYLEQAARLHRELDEDVEVAIDLWRFAQALAGVGRYEAAVELSSLSAALRDELNATIAWVDRKADETLVEAKGKLDEGTFRRAWERGKRLTVDAAIAAAMGAAGS